MASITLTVPPEIVPTVQRGALNEVELAAEAILALCDPHSEEPESAFVTAFAQLNAAGGFLAEVGYTLPQPPVAVEVNLIKHLWMFLRVIVGQRRADMELAEDRNPAEQGAADHRIRVLEELISAVAADC